MIRTFQQNMVDLLAVLLMLPDVVGNILQEVVFTTILLVQLGIKYIPINVLILVLHKILQTDQIVFNHIIKKKTLADGLNLVSLIIQVLFSPLLEKNQIFHLTLIAVKQLFQTHQTKLQILKLLVAIKIKHEHPITTYLNLVGI